MIDVERLQTIINFLERTSFEEISLEYENLRISVKRSVCGGVKEKIEPITTENVQRENAEEYIVRSPIVGTVYLSPHPNEPPYVNVSSKVSENQTICVVETMKIFNEIKSDVDGVVFKILVKNNTPVEYNQPLFIIKRNFDFN